MARGSSADQRSANPRLGASFIARGRTQIIPRDRIQISKTSSLQSHRRMGVMKQDGSNRRMILESGADVLRPKQRHSPSTRAGSTVRQSHSAKVRLVQLAYLGCPWREVGVSIGVIFMFSAHQPMQCDRRRCMPGRACRRVLPSYCVPPRHRRVSSMTQIFRSADQNVRVCSASRQIRCTK
jgi:hypothetical protein